MVRLNSLEKPDKLIVTIYDDKMTAVVHPYLPLFTAIQFAQCASVFYDISA